MFCNGLGLTYLKLMPEDPDAGDRAIESFTAASVFYEAAGQWRMKAHVENNLAVVHAEAGRVDAALEHVALALRSCPADEEVLAQVEDTRALIALAAGDAERALEHSRAAEARARRVGNLRLVAMCVKTSRRAEDAYLHAMEEASLRAMLDACGWNLTRAARCLGFNSLHAFKNHLRRKFPRLDAERLNKRVQSKPGA
jgi:tetratricopeptide (TPR) repeat protein